MTSRQFGRWKQVLISILCFCVLEQTNPFVDHFYFIFLILYFTACNPGGNTRRTPPTERPTSRPSTVRPSKIHRHRIFRFIVTSKPALKKTCNAPNVCLSDCGVNKYVLGRYGCNVGSWCCASR